MYFFFLLKTDIYSFHTVYFFKVKFFNNFLKQISKQAKNKTINK